LNLTTVASLAAAVGTFLAAIALILNVRQSRQLEQSIRGNTYQQLANYALELYKILLETPALSYLDLPSDSKEGREQILFDRLLGNYLENIWLQRRYGLVDEELAAAYDGLLRKVLLHHPKVQHEMSGDNYVQSLRKYIATLEAEVDHSKSAARTSTASSTDADVSPTNIA